MTAAATLDPLARRLAGLRWFCRSSAILVLALGCSVLVGWAFNIAPLVSVFPGLATMKINTALGLIFSAISLCFVLLPGESSFPRRGVARFFALLVVLIGAATLAEYFFTLDLHIDQFFMADHFSSHGTSSPGRPSHLTAIALLAIGSALLLVELDPPRGPNPSQMLCLASGLIGMLSLCAYLYKAIAVSRIFMYTQVAVHTAAAILLLSVGIFFARPDRGIAWQITREGSGGVLARRFLPAIFFVPVTLGWIRLQGQIAGFYGTEMGLVLFATSNIIVFAVLVWLSARQMNREYDRRSAAELAIREFNADLESRVAERTTALERQAVLLTEQAALLDLAHDAIFVRDTRDRVTFWSKGAARKYGWTADSALGRTSHELLRTEFPIPFEQIQARLLDQGYWDGELIHTCANDSRITVASRWALQRDSAGQPRATLEINTDITDRKRAEARLGLIMDDLKRSNDELQQFAYVASHDLQEPLRMVASYTQLLAKRYAGQLDADADQFIAYAVDGCNRMQDLIQDLLAYSRAGSESKDLREISTELALQNALACLENSLRENDAQVTHDPLPAVTADDRMLAQVFQNLIGNAVKYHGPDAPRVHVSAARNGHSQWVFSVRDNGIGIDPQYFQRIFVIFQRLHGREKFKGTGIGLAICKKIVERLGGRIWVESQLGKGSTFCFTIPDRSEAT